MTDSADHEHVTPTAAGDLFGDRVELATQYVAMLRVHGSQRGLIGPREVDRLWDRHILNSAAIAELIPVGSSVVDVGSGAGLPGVPLAIARPDLDIVLLEPMARRVAWLEEVTTRLGLQVAVVRGRAEERSVREQCGRFDVVTGRALAPLGKLSGWCLPLARAGGVVLAMKGASAADEVSRDEGVMRANGARDIRVVRCGSEGIADPVTVVSMRRTKSASKPRRGPRTTTGARGRRSK